MLDLKGGMRYVNVRSQGEDIIGFEISGIDKVKIGQGGGGRKGEISRCELLGVKMVRYVEGKSQRENV